MILNLCKHNERIQRCSFERNHEIRNTKYLCGKDYEKAQHFICIIICTSSQGKWQREFAKSHLWLVWMRAYRATKTYSSIFFLDFDVVCNQKTFLLNRSVQPCNSVCDLSVLILLTVNIHVAFTNEKTDWVLQETNTVLKELLAMKKTGVLLMI